MSLGSTSRYDSSLSDGIEGTTDRALGLSTSGINSGVGSSSTIEIALSLGTSSGSGVGSGLGQWHCAVSKSVETSDGHTSAVMYSVGAGVTPTSAEP